MINKLYILTQRIVAQGRDQVRTGTCMDMQYPSIKICTLVGDTLVEPLQMAVGTSRCSHPIVKLLGTTHRLMEMLGYRSMASLGRLRTMIDAMSTSHPPLP